MTRVFRFLPSAFCFLLVELAEACPWCKDALWSPGDASAQAYLARGYNLTILGLMAIPLLLVGGLATLIIRSARRARRAH